MKTKFLILTCLIIISLLPANLVYSQNEENIPEAPKFLRITPNPAGPNQGQHKYNENETISIEYETDRFSVEGVILVGEGSGLILDPDHENVTKMERGESARGRTIWKAEINVTSYSYFYAYSWDVDVTNRTIEDLDLLDGAPGHQIWLTSGPIYPTLFNVTNAIPEDSTDPKQAVEFYAPRYSNVTIVYEVVESGNQTQDVTLSISNSSDGVYNSSTSLRYEMNQTTFSENARSRFELEINVTQRIMYFSAFSEYGWDRTLESVPTPVTRSINTGFKFNATFSEALTNYTSFDTISFNVTSRNETSDDSFSYRYRYFENSTSEDALVNWTDVSIDADFIEQFIYNTTSGGVNKTQVENVYRVVLDIDFNVSQVVHIQPYVTYFDEVYNDTLRIIEIHDPNPTINILSKNGTQTAGGSSTIIFEFSEPRGEITPGKITSNQTDIDVTITKSTENYTYFFENDTGVIEGYHLVTINITSTFTILNTTDSNFTRYEVVTWNITNVVFQVDITKPIGDFVNPPTGSTELGVVTVSFTFSDPGISPTGIKLVKLDWGDQTAVNVTSRSQATHTYRRSGTFDIVLTFWDNVENNDSRTITVTVTVPTTNNSTNQPSPVPIVPIILSISFIALFRINKRKE